LKRCRVPRSAKIARLRESKRQPRLSSYVVELAADDFELERVGHVSLTMVWRQ
jgi:hypothetical protein